MDILHENSSKKCPVSALERCPPYRELMYREMFCTAGTSKLVPRLGGEVIAQTSYGLVFLYYSTDNRKMKFICFCLVDIREKSIAIENVCGIIGAWKYMKTINPRVTIN